MKLNVGAVVLGLLLSSMSLTAFAESAARAAFNALPRPPVGYAGSFGWHKLDVSAGIDLRSKLSSIAISGSPVNVLARDGRSQGGERLISGYLYNTTQAGSSEVLMITTVAPRVELNFGRPNSHGWSSKPSDDTMTAVKLENVIGLKHYRH